MNEAAANGHLHVVRWLHENRAEGCTAYAVREAAANVHRAVLDSLAVACPQFKCETAAAASTADNERFEVIAWLEQHDPQQAASIVLKLLRQHKAKLVQAYINEEEDVANIEYDNEGEYVDDFRYGDDDYDVYG